MKNISNTVLTKAVWTLVMGLFLAGPVFGNEPVTAAAPPSNVEAAPVEPLKSETKSESKMEKPVKKNGRRKHKHSKGEQKPVQPESAPVSK